MTEAPQEYITDALEMMGAGYASIEIEQAKTVISRRAGRMVSEDRPAFVKVSTAFKQELSVISGDALKVWLFIALSINRNTGKANPGLRTIAESVNLAVNTVQKALKELEGMELLTVDRETKRYNIYETPEYISANKAEPTVSSGDTPEQSVSNYGETVSNSEQSVSPSVILNQNNQNNQNGKITEQQAETLKKYGLEWMLLQADVSSSDIEKVLIEEERKHSATRMFEKALGFSKPLPWWDGKEWTAFSEWVCAEYEKSNKSFGEYNVWRNTPYTKGGIANTRLRGFITEFYDSWDMFMMSKPQTAKVEPKTYDPAAEVEPEYVPAPPRKK